MTKEKPSENNLSTAVETIRLLGEHVIELREIIEQQSKDIQKLKAQQESLFDAYKELVGDFKMVKIDQKDIAKKLRDIASQKKVETVIEEKETLTENDVPDYEQIVAKYYPAYKNKKEVFLDKKDDDGGFSFARLPKFLNLD